MKKIAASFLFIFLSLQFFAQNGTVKSYIKISQTQGNLPVTLANGDQFGVSISSIGDLNKDGVKDLAIGSHKGQTDGVLFITFLNSNGSVKSVTEIRKGQSGLSSSLSYNMTYFGYSVDTIGDLNQDGVVDLVVGDPYTSTGSYKGFVFVLFMNSDGTVKSYKVIGENLSGFSENLSNTRFGYSVAGIGDIDNDGNFDIAVGGPKTGGDKGAIWILLLNSDGTVKNQYRIDSNNSTILNYFNQSLNQMILFGSSISSLKDLNNDGVKDIAVGSIAFQTQKGNGGAAIIFFNSNITIKNIKRIDQGASNFSDSLINFYDTLNPTIMSRFGQSISNIGDINGDHIDDIAITAPSFGESQCSGCGGLEIFMLDTNGNIKNYQRISDSIGNFSGNLIAGDYFGSSVKGFGDFNGDKIVDIVVGAFNDDDGGSNRGAVYILNLNGVPDTSPVEYLELNSSIKVYPNPAKELVTIEVDFPNNKETCWQLQDIQGKVYNKGTLPANEKTTTITTNSLANGIYIIKLLTQNQLIAKKIVISGN